MCIRDRAFEDLDGGGVHLDPGEDLLVADTTARVGVGDVDEFLDGVLAVANHVGGDALGDGLHPAADDEAAIVATGDERLDDCLLYTSDAADERSSVDLGGRRIIKTKKAGRCDTKSNNIKKKTKST